MSKKQIAYWIATVVVAGELIVGGWWDLARNPYVVDVIMRLGYPVYLLTIVGACKVPGGLVLLAPRLRRLKEWAYAGAVFEMGGAVASLALSHATFSAMVAPFLFAGLTLTSWALRPSDRTLAEPGPYRTMRRTGALRSINDEQ